MATRMPLEAIWAMLLLAVRVLPFRRRLARPEPPSAPAGVVVKRPKGGLTISTDARDRWRAVLARLQNPKDRPPSA